METKNIILVLRSGGDFNLCDVNLLVAHIHKYWNTETKKPNIYCITDIIAKKTELKGFTLLPMEHKWVGWWSLFNIYSPILKHLRPFMLLGLDTVILGDISNVFPKKENWNKFIPIEDFYQKSRLASGVLWVGNEEKVSVIWDKFIESSDFLINQNRRGDYFLRNVIIPDLFFQTITNQIITFKPKGKWLKEQPKQSIVCFHGYPRILEAAKTIDWIKKYVNYEI